MPPLSSNLEEVPLYFRLYLNGSVPSSKKEKCCGIRTEFGRRLPIFFFFPPSLKLKKANTFMKSKENSDLRNIDLLTLLGEEGTPFLHFQ